MVRTDLPATSRIGVEQERMASPLRCTVQAPQSPAPQPNLVPVMSSSSRRYQSSGVSGSPSKDRSFPFTLSLIMSTFPLWQSKGEDGAARGHRYHLFAVHRVCHWIGGHRTSEVDPPQLFSIIRI